MGSKRRAKKAEVRVKKLKKSLATVRAELEKSQTRLEKTEAEAARRKEEAAGYRASAERYAARVKRLEKESNQASTPARSDDRRPARRVAATSKPERVPDDTWTVARLRAEARSRGLTGMSKTNKAELLEALASR